MSGNFGTFLLRQLRRLRRNEDGVTAIEFGLLALPFFGIIGAIMQTSLVFLASQVLESAVHDASRAIRTGQAQAAGTTLEQFRTDVCNRLYRLLPDCDGLHVRVNVVTNFESATVEPPLPQPCTAPCDWTESESFAPGTGRSVVLVQVYYRYPIVIQLGPLGLSNMADGRRLMGSVAVFQNEPFS
ncbi:TadE/TadG family type IV pilus assembly protein [Devosia sediminis]|uniref:Pilus assembly protein n=1 Tax=Devosia sediminis TaxID=2798801 RepID=A0A934IPW2_9HYPH|nr:TadE/TadG family type IV pilus assembly protein [Devosia sediminis]MBJ3784644.1 pilus assembly protein [Devosia sediminis]